MARSLNAQLIQNVPLAAKPITQQRNVDVVPEATFVPKGIDRTPKIRTPLKTETPTLKMTNLKHLHQATPIRRSLEDSKN